MQKILNVRTCNRWKGGFNEEIICSRVKTWTRELQINIVNSWERDGINANGDLVVVERYLKEVLKPWAERANEQLAEYTQWKCAREGTSILTLPPLTSIDPNVPELYRDVLNHLRCADKCGQWPTTSLKRQLVISTTNATESLSIAHKVAKENKALRSSAYASNEGDGGASGSFSVGAMPGAGCEEPRGNMLFPDLMRAAFKLEKLLCPEREGSSTIAINRNAQFRPHTDSGAGAGQSTSLIVGLGTYDGGDLVVEGEKIDIRYKGVQFDGWTQRHWTMPFRGERYSLVWFTPKGCEGVRGLDL